MSEIFRIIHKKISSLWEKYSFAIFIGTLLAYFIIFLLVRNFYSYQSARNNTYDNWFIIGRFDATVNAIFWPFKIQEMKELTGTNSVPALVKFFVSGSRLIPLEIQHKRSMALHELSDFVDAVNYVQKVRIMSNVNDSIHEALITDLEFIVQMVNEYGELERTHMKNLAPMLPRHFEEEFLPGVGYYLLHLKRSDNKMLAESKNRLDQFYKYWDSIAEDKESK
ncbi:MAG: hypothetical protein JNL74_20040 [Fibrobacteres bacterium]|nr:hypothetical protein [Fibrobacterota bacterium]